ncbi:MAG: pseudaminic acid synthase, partial [Rhodospirillaceae bacterium]|nr:pseudaminic acid synthase [Rhodospirillaceae bacterium]
MKLKIGGQTLGPGHKPYILAEMSGNHNHSLDTALQIVDAAAACGADAIKLQTYTPDTLTLNSHKPEFFLPAEGSIWKGMRLWDLYKDAYTPWEWHAPIFERARKLGLGCISTAFEGTSVDLLRELNVDAIKIASFELINLPLIKAAASIGKPIILSTGMATQAEIADAVNTVRAAGNSDMILLKCTSSYPALPEDANLMTIPDIATKFGCLVGLSDHTMSNTGVIASVALGAVLIEKHFTLSRAVEGPDSSFSLEPAEFQGMVQAAQEAAASLGAV